MAGKWDGKISNLNISERGFPELYQELSQMHHKTRSDRLRALALLGLYSLRFSGNLATVEQQSSARHPAHETRSTHVDAKLSAHRNSLKEKLMSSV